LATGIGALIAGSANKVMPVMTPNNDFNAKRVMILPPQLPSRGQISVPTGLRVPETSPAPDARSEKKNGPETTNRRGSGVDSPNRHPNADRRTHTRAVPHRPDILPQRRPGAALQRPAGEPPRSRKRWEPAPRRPQAVLPGARPQRSLKSAASAGAANTRAVAAPRLMGIFLVFQRWLNGAFSDL
jgi:hypothetical protein